MCAKPVVKLLSPKLLTDALVHTNLSTPVPNQNVELLDAWQVRQEIDNTLWGVLRMAETTGLVTSMVDGQDLDLADVIGVEVALPRPEIGWRRCDELIDFKVDVHCSLLVLLWKVEATIFVSIIMRPLRNTCLVVSQSLPSHFPRGEKDRGSTLIILAEDPENSGCVGCDFPYFVLDLPRQLGEENKLLEWFCWELESWKLDKKGLETGRHLSRGEQEFGGRLRGLFRGLSCTDFGGLEIPLWRLLLGCCYGDEKAVKPTCCVAVYEVEIPRSDGMSMESVVDQEGGLT
jgi:hypothetical protein